MNTKQIFENILVIDKNGPMERLDGDEELYQDLLKLYREDAPVQLEILKEQLAAGDLSVAERQAHSLKSASANVGAEKLRAIAFEMEKASRSGDGVLVKDLVSCFEEALKEFLSLP